jgi:hypothetical protein
MSEISDSEIKSDYVVYKIELSDGSVYIGSTCNFENRVRRHIHDCYNKTSVHYIKPLYQYIRENDIILTKDNIVPICIYLEVYQNQAFRLEEFHRKLSEESGCVVLNDRKAHRTEEEIKIYKQEYSKSDSRKESLHKYNTSEKRKIVSLRYENSEKGKATKERRKEKVNCPCGSIVTKIHLKRHEKTKKHLDYIAKNQK